MKIKVKTLKKLIESQIALSEASVLDDISGVDHLVRTLQYATSRNDHSGAIVELAKFTKDAGLISIAEAIQTIQRVWGSIPKNLQAFRDSEFQDRLLKFIETKYGKNDRDKVYRSL